MSHLICFSMKLNIYHLTRTYGFWRRMKQFCKNSGNKGMWYCNNVSFQSKCCRILPTSQLSNIQLSNTQLTNQLPLSVSTPVSSTDTSKQELENSSAHSGQIASTSINSPISPKKPPQQEQLQINSPAAKSSPVQQESSTDTADKSQNSKESK